MTERPELTTSEYLCRLGDSFLGLRWTRGLEEGRDLPESRGTLIAIVECADKVLSFFRVVEGELVSIWCTKA